ncbi:MAG TPA: 3-hydroxybenzoate 6-monooxygenase [Beijerinckiaceae bacterium]|nr:3-hydroxybenzoate 6-monooxygenase [Beijerinckiaceae bacterium]
MAGADKGLPVLIAGGGIGGCVTALALAQRGIASRVFEQADEFREVGAGIQLGPNAFKMFDRLRLTAAIDKVAWFPDKLVMMDNLTGERVVSMALDEAHLARFHYPYGVIHRADLLDVIVAACRARADLIELNTSSKVVAHEDRGHCVSITLESGARHEGAALIGAEGLWSRIRESVIGDGKPRVSGHIAYRAVLPRAEVPEDLWSPSIVLWGGEKRHLVHYPLRRGELYNLVVVFHSQRYEEGWDAYGDPDELNERFANAVPQCKRLLEKIESWRMWVLCDREPMKNWSSNRITLIGDAAHPMLQYLAQGAVMSMEDAWVLANCVEEAKGDYPQAFLAYQQARYLRTARVQLTARLYGDIYHAAGATRELRNQMLSQGKGSSEGMAWLYDGV